MLILGTGHYYNVYDLGTGRVRKIEKTLTEKVRDTSRFKNEAHTNRVSLILKIMAKRKSITATNIILFQHADLSLLGFPKFLKGIDYEQNKVVMLGEAFRNATPVEARGIIDAYIQSILECWQSGFADRTFEFATNNGLDNGRVILIDFNEIAFSKDEARERIQTKRWLRAQSYAELPQALQKYYNERMEATLTEAALTANWRQIPRAPSS